MPQHVMAVMDRALGDLQVVWDPSRPVEVEAAREQFDKLRKKGYLAYSVKDGSSKKNSLVRTFDPAAEKLILAPPLVGG